MLALSTLQTRTSHLFNFYQSLSMSPLISIMPKHTLSRRCQEYISCWPQTMFLEILNWDYFINLILFTVFITVTERILWKVLVSLEQTKSFKSQLQWNCQGYGHNPGMLVSLWNHPKSPPKTIVYSSKLSPDIPFGVEWLTSPFSRPVNHMSPNTHSS